MNSIPFSHRPIRWRIFRGALRVVVLFFAMAAGTASADHGGSHDHEAAREAVLQGRVLPLRAVLDKVEREYPGQVVKIEFEEDDDLYVYKIKVLRSTGDIVKLKVDATDGRVLAVRARETLSGDD